MKEIFKLLKLVSLVYIVFLSVTLLWTAMDKGLFIQFLAFPFSWFSKHGWGEIFYAAFVCGLPVWLILYATFSSNPFGLGSPRPAKNVAKPVSRAVSKPSQHASRSVSPTTATAVLGVGAVGAYQRMQANKELNEMNENLNNAAQDSGVDVGGVDVGGFDPGCCFF